MSVAPLIAQKIKLPRALPPVLGVGAYLKNALCLIQGDEAWISRENGSLDQADSVRAFQETARGLLAEAKIKPIAVAHDLHPDFYGTRWAYESGRPCIEVQHHHAHVAAVMAEYGICEPVLGLALDGFGLGENNEAWGGELLGCDGASYRRIGRLRPLPQPGGDKAALQPWRMGAAALWAMGRGAEIATRYAAFPGAANLDTMMTRGINAPMTSSAGRLFDAACGLLNVKLLASFDGEAPMELERLAAGSIRESNPKGRIDSGFGRLTAEKGLLELDLRPLLAEISSLAAEEGAVLFHDELVIELRKWIKKALEHTEIKKITMSGGCFFNKILRTRLTASLAAEGFEPLLPSALVPGDTAIALGQAYAASLRLEKEVAR